MTRYSRIATKTTKQIDTLYERGLDITNDVDTQHKIRNIGYFKLKGYCDPFFDRKDHFKAGSSFYKIYDSYIFDQELHKVLFSLFLRVETQLKSQLGGFFAQKYGPLCYLDSDIFRTDDYKNGFLETIESDKEKAQMRNEKYMQHYLSEYDNTFPIWIIFEMATMGTISRFYSDILTADQKEFSSNIYNINNKKMENWLHYITLVRNSCAHNSRTFYKRMSTKAVVNEPGHNSYLNQNTLFPVLYMLKKLCFSNDFYQKSLTEIRCDLNHHDSIDIGHWGFPEDWYDFLSRVEGPHTNKNVLI